MEHLNSEDLGELFVIKTELIGSDEEIHQVKLLGILTAIGAFVGMDSKEVPVYTFNCRDGAVYTTTDPKEITKATGFDIDGI